MFTIVCVCRALSRRFSVGKLNVNIFDLVQWRLALDWAFMRLSRLVFLPALVVEDAMSQCASPAQKNIGLSFQVYSVLTLTPNKARAILSIEHAHWALPRSSEISVWWQLLFTLAPSRVAFRATVNSSVMTVVLLVAPNIRAALRVSLPAPSTRPATMGAFHKAPSRIAAEWALVVMGRVPAFATGLECISSLDLLRCFNGQSKALGSLVGGGHREDASGLSGEGEGKSELHSEWLIGCLRFVVVV